MIRKKFIAKSKKVLGQKLKKVWEMTKYMIGVLSLAFLVMFSATASAQSQTVTTESTSTSNVTTKGTTESTIKSPPPSAISPSVSSSSSDLCTVGVSGAVQTQILGISGGSTVRDMNCERLKLSKTLYDMGMKVAAVSVLCQDTRVFDAMEMAGTPCPFEGKIGNQAKESWDDHPEMKPHAAEEEKKGQDFEKGAAAGVGFSLLLLLLL